MNVAISGLTAAGKTTHARLLAHWLGYEYISATAMLLDLSGLSHVLSDGVWFRGDERIQATLTNMDLNRKLTRELRNMARRRQGVVFDTWGLPWFYEGPLLRIWLESDRLSRSWKCYVSQRPPREHAIEQCAHLINSKDIRTRSVFLRQYGFDIFHDRSVFDIVVDSTWFISEPTSVSSEVGIAAIDWILQHAAKKILGEDAPEPGINARSADLESTYLGHPCAIRQGGVLRPWKYDMKVPSRRR